MAAALIERLRAQGWLDRSEAAGLAGGEPALAQALALYASLGLPVAEEPGALRWREDAPALLDARRIQAGVGGGCAVEVRTLTGSTNADLLALAAAGEGGPRALFAQVQSAGRGRRERRWRARYGEALLFSLLVRIGRRPGELPGVALAAGVVLAETLAGFGVPVRVKWPNDLVVGDAKLGGLLVEAASAASGTVVVGVGVNWRTPADERIDRPVAALANRVSSDRSTVAGELVAALLRMAGEFRAEGLPAFLPRFAALDALAGRAVDVDNGTTRLPGIALGVAADGALRVAHDGVERRHYSADVSVRPA